MSDYQNKIEQLLARLEFLSERQNNFSKEIENLRFEVTQLLKREDNSLKQIKDGNRDETEQDKITIDLKIDEKQKVVSRIKSIPKRRKNSKINIDLEKFIGENLINKVGILITVIGVGIGAKYSIENNLISPLTRIILGYLVGLGLLGFGIKLKDKYENYSAVLVSGAIAIMYFITYASYAFYSLIPQGFAFILMVIFTIFSVIASIKYNKQTIAHIGLVGAYAVPFLLSDGSGNVAILFSYMSIINIGILIISFKKYWKPLYFSAFGFTWVIFISWYVSEYNINSFFALALIFIFIFFTIFYLTILSYKLIKKEKFNSNDIILLLLNSFIFYGLGYSILNRHEIGEQYLGLFTLFNAMIHFVFSLVIYKQKLADKNLFYLILGMVLVFITIAIPVQLDGSWVTLLWASEAALLFWIGRTKNIPIYEKLSYPLIFIAFFSLIHDWLLVYSLYDTEVRLIPIFNVNFLPSLLFILAIGFINYLNSIKYKPQNLILHKFLSKVISISIPSILIIAIYYAFRLEIANYWNQLYWDSKLTFENNDLYPKQYWNSNLRNFKTVWILNYSLFFVAVLTYLNFKIFKNKKNVILILSLVTIVVFVFLTQGLYNLSELRENYLEQSLSEYYKIGTVNIVIRYISFVFIILLLLVTDRYIRQDFIKKEFKIGYDLLLHISILWILSSELINWMDFAEYSQSYKLGLSILWGIYSLFLIAYGIWKKYKLLRIGAIALFAITLVKLFFYDISHLDTIAKTIVFVSLGVLLLIISFLYNKYKHIISNEVSN